MIYQTIDSFSQFQDAFRRMGRHDQFSYEALKALYAYLEDMGEDYELDVIGLCCEFSEIDSDDDEWPQYCEGGEREEQVIAYLEHSVLVREE